MKQIEKTSPFRLDADKLSALKMILSLRFEDILSDLITELNWDGAGWRGPCPVHGGDNSTAILLYNEGDICPGYWKCYTKGCHKHFNSTLIGFVQGCLSHQKYNWQSPGDNKVSFKDAVHWICKSLSLNFHKLNPEKICNEKAKFNKTLKNIFPTKNETKGIPQGLFLKSLKIPSQYFLDREFSADTLTHFKIGDATSCGKRMSGRAIVPILDSLGEAQGFTGRSFFEKCKNCGLFHQDATCPKSEFSLFYSKWINSKGFKADSVLYNLDQIKIKKPKVVVLCEGSPDVWRLYEAGIDGVAMLGDDLSDNQQVLLETSGVYGVIVGTDNDPAGEEAASRITKKLERSFWVERWRPTAKDAADMPAEVIRDEVIPLIEKIERKL